MNLQTEFKFDGKTFSPEFDQERLKGQSQRVFNLMKDGVWRTLDEIHYETNDPQASISSRLRDFRKFKFGSHTVERRSRGIREHGVFEYRLIVNEVVS